MTAVAGECQLRLVNNTAISDLSVTRYIYIKLLCYWFIVGRRYCSPLSLSYTPLRYVIGFFFFWGGGGDNALHYIYPEATHYTVYLFCWETMLYTISILKLHTIQYIFLVGRQCFLHYIYPEATHYTVFLFCRETMFYTTSTQSYTLYNISFLVGRQCFTLYLS